MIAHKGVLSAVAIMFLCWTSDGVEEGQGAFWMGEGPTNAVWHDRLPEVRIKEMGRQAVWDLLEATSRVVRCGSQGVSICDGSAGTCTQAERPLTFVGTNVPLVSVFLAALNAAECDAVYAGSRAIVGYSRLKIMEVRRKGICVDRQSGKGVANVHMEVANFVGSVNVDSRTGEFDLYGMVWLRCIALAPGVIAIDEKEFRLTEMLGARADGYVSVTNEVELFPRQLGSLVYIEMEKKGTGTSVRR